MQKKSLFLLGTGALALLGAGMAAQAQEAPTREIVNVSGNLYRASNNTHHAVFLVTDAGIILADPINADFSRWLRGQLEQRFGQPVKYVVYSHHHWDHASGGAVFDDTAIFVGHENMLRNLAMPPADTALPEAAKAMDANDNGALEQGETSGNYQANFALFDADANGVISGAEASRGPVSAVRAPDVVYSDHMSINLGGEQVELLYAGVMTHGDDMSIIRFPSERTIFVVDWISIGRLPFRTLGTGMLNAWLNSIRMAEALDYDTVVGGHGQIGGKDGVTAVRLYLEELRDQVAAGMAAGRSLAELQESIRMERYRDWMNYEEWRPLNIEGMYTILGNETAAP
ncbi:MAG: MBL fold metallo-hydrolase [Gammaproteobacteria bacterium]|nr:MBL fold metallo-hydrolase [Gammaproteobacteria bacterium]MDH5304658.1 MBL fold metallo-hydrolase [Gammaproteobacteria bacterium]